MKWILISALLFLILRTNDCFGQNDWKAGFIIKNGNDTVYGFIDNRESVSNSRQCYFRKEEKGETQIFTPTELVGYRFTDDKFFISKSIEGIESGNLLFLEFLIKGKVNVYHYKDSDDHYFIEKDAKIYELQNTKELKAVKDQNYIVEKKEYIGMLGFLLKDANIQKAIEESTFRSQSLIELAKVYHEKICPNETCIVYERSVKTIHVIQSVHTGLSLNKINFGDRTISDYRSGGFIGYRLEFENVLDWDRNISFAVDFNFQRFSNYKLTETKGNVSEILYNNVLSVLGPPTSYKTTGTSLDVNIKTVGLKIPITVIKTFSKGSTRPYIAAGILNMIKLSQNKDFIYYDFYNELEKSIPVYHLGLTGRTGFKKMFKNNQAMYFELNYEYSQSMNVNEFYNFFTNSFSMNLGYIF